jgi:hypothetical protein
MQDLNLRKTDLRSVALIHLANQTAIRFTPLRLLSDRALRHTLNPLVGAPVGVTEPEP